MEDLKYAHFEKHKLLTTQIHELPEEMDTCLYYLFYCTIFIIINHLLSSTSSETFLTEQLASNVTGALTNGGRN